MTRTLRADLAKMCPINWAMPHFIKLIPRGDVYTVEENLFFLAGRKLKNRSKVPFDLVLHFYDVIPSVSIFFSFSHIIKFITPECASVCVFPFLFS